jgi:hypothetical protein
MPNCLRAETAVDWASALGRLAHHTSYVLCPHTSAAGL